MLQASKVWDCNFYVKYIQQKKCCYSNTDDVLKNPTHSNIKSQKKVKTNLCFQNRVHVFRVFARKGFREQ